MQSKEQHLQLLLHPLCLQTVLSLNASVVLGVGQYVHTLQNCMHCATHSAICMRICQPACDGYALQLAVVRKLCTAVAT